MEDVRRKMGEARNAWINQWPELRQKREEQLATVDIKLPQLKALRSTLRCGKWSELVFGHLAFLLDNVKMSDLLVGEHAGAGILAATAARNAIVGFAYDGGGFAQSTDPRDPVAGLLFTVHCTGLQDALLTFLAKAGPPRPVRKVCD